MWPAYRAGILNRTLEVRHKAGYLVGWLGIVCGGSGRVTMNIAAPDRTIIWHPITQSGASKNHAAIGVRMIITIAVRLVFESMLLYLCQLSMSGPKIR